MSLESELTALTRKYLASEVDLHELYMWVQDRQEAIAKLPLESITNELSGTIMLASIEKSGGYRDEASARDYIAQDFVRLLGASSHL
jgi:hypothetical protein